MMFHNKQRSRQGGGMGWLVWFGSVRVMLHFMIDYDVEKLHFSNQFVSFFPANL